MINLENLYNNVFWWVQAHRQIHGLNDCRNWNNGPQFCSCLEYDLRSFLCSCYLMALRSLATLSQNHIYLKMRIVLICNTCISKIQLHKIYHIFLRRPAQFLFFYKHNTLQVIINFSNLYPFKIFIRRLSL